MAKPASGRAVYGLHAVRALLERRPGTIARARVLANDSSPALREIESALRAAGVGVEHVPRRTLDHACEGGRHQGVVLDVRGGLEFPLDELEALVIERGPALKLLVLDQVEDPRNLGACLRTADAAGVDALVIPKNRSASLTPVAIKAAAGAAETVPVHRATNLARVLAWLKEAGLRIVGADDAAAQSLYECRFELPAGIALGGEGRGLRRLTREHCDELVAIPMHGRLASLNVSVAAGVVLYELTRQLGPGSVADPGS